MNINIKPLENAFNTIPTAQLMSKIYEVDLHCLSLEERQTGYNNIVHWIENCGYNEERKEKFNKILDKQFKL